MRICLINPPLALGKKAGSAPIFQPIGLAYIAAVLENIHEVNVIDANVGNRLSIEEVAKAITSFRPDAVGISVPFSVNTKSALNVAAAVKSISKKTITILGGPHPSVRPIETL